MVLGQYTGIIAGTGSILHTATLLNNIPGMCQAISPALLYQQYRGTPTFCSCEIDRLRELHNMDTKISNKCQLRTYRLFVAVSSTN